MQQGRISFDLRRLFDYHSRHSIIIRNPEPKTRSFSRAAVSRDQEPFLTSR